MRKISLLFCISLSLLVNSVFSQTTGNFNYQAVVRDTESNLITNQSMTVQLSIIESTSDGTEIYTETHSVTSTDAGLINLMVGNGISSLGDFESINWGENPKFIKIEIDIGNDLVDMGTFQLLSVPYALYAKSADKLGDENIYSPVSDTLFVVKDHEGNVVFAVFPDGAQVYVNETAKGKVGGFAISGRSPSKAIETDIFRVTADSTRIYVNDTISSKGKVGGFAISGRSPSKGTVNDYMVITGDSTRIYINDTSAAKGKVGGFAISGRSPSKGPTNDYLQINRDSARIYITESDIKGKVGGFAISGRSPSKEGFNEKDYFNVSGNTSAEIINNEARIMWYPKKSAFLAGEVHVGSADSVGTNSTALGYRPISMGDQSQAFGYKAFAEGDNSTAIGNNAITKGHESYALGNFAIALDSGSYAIGSGASATGLRSFALGSTGVDSSGIATSPTLATADYAYAFGMGSIASAKGSFAFGTQDTASGEFSTALGYQTKSTDWYSIALGQKTVSSGYSSTSMGDRTTASGNASTAMGRFTTASSSFSTAMGFGTMASGPNSTAMGQLTTASGHISTAMGYGTIASGDYSTAMGLSTIASDYYCTALGCRTKASGYFSTSAGYYSIARSYMSFVIGRYNDTLTISSRTSWEETDPLFIIGNGTADDDRNNAVTVLKNGNFGIDTIAPSRKFFVNGDAGGTTAWFNDSDIRLKKNINTITDALDRVMKLRGVNFEWKDENHVEKGINLGFIAQEALEVIPEVVDTSNETYSMQYAPITAILVEATKEQQSQIEELELENQELRKENEEIKTRLTEIEKLLMAK